MKLFAHGAARPHSFAAMLGLARAEDEHPEDPDARRAKAEGDAPADPDKDKDKDKDAKAKAEEGEPCPACDGTGLNSDGSACDACDGTGKVGGVGAKKAEDAPKEENPDDETDETKKATKAERARWGQAMAYALKEGKATAACALLHDTPLSAARIIETLGALPADTAPKARLGQRMAGAGTPSIGPDGPAAAKPDTPAAEAAALAASIVAAGDKARGVVRT